MSNEDCMQKLRPQEVDVLTYPNGAHMNFCASSPRVRFLDVIISQNWINGHIQSLHDLNPTARA
jgi:hypothetical protein